MTWRITSSAALRADIRAVGYDLAERALGAVRRFAETGEGKAYPVDIGASVWRLFVPGGQVLLHADVDADALEVLRILPDDPLPFVVPLLDEPADEDDD